MTVKKKMKFEEGIFDQKYLFGWVFIYTDKETLLLNCYISLDTSFFTKLQIRDEKLSLEFIFTQFDPLFEENKS